MLRNSKEEQFCEEEKIRIVAGLRELMRNKQIVAWVHGDQVRIDKVREAWDRAMPRLISWRRAAEIVYEGQLEAPKRRPPTVELKMRLRRAVG